MDAVAGRAGHYLSSVAAVPRTVAVRTRRETPVLVVGRKVAALARRIGLCFHITEGVRTGQPRSRRRIRNCRYNHGS